MLVRVTFSEMYGECEEKIQTVKRAVAQLRKSKVFKQVPRRPHYPVPLRTPRAARGKQQQHHAAMVTTSTHMVAGARVRAGVRQLPQRRLEQGRGVGLQLTLAPALTLTLTLPTDH